MPYFINSYKQSIDIFKDNVESKIYSEISELSMEAWVTKEPVAFEERTSGRKISPKIDETWGEIWDCAWFNFKGIVPKEAANEKIVLLIDINGEACIFDELGCPIQGLTNISSEFDLTLGKPGKRVVDLLSHAQGGEIVNLWADAGCNDLFGNCQDSGIIKEAHIAIFNEDLKELYYDIEVLKELMEELSENTARHQKILFSLIQAFKVMKNYDHSEIEKARGILALELNKKAGDESLRVSAIGHAHIDLAWLWPLRETIRKGARTFSTVLSNMEKYPDYVFGASQPQLYEWMKVNYSKLYEKIKEKIAEGRWEAQGGMWVEADTNVTSGEALVRQFLYGQKFFREEFGKNMKVLWLPDVFGYSAALPQILKKADIDYFMTIKLSWNEYNEFPHHTFYWEGIDGTKILSHMPPEGTYNSSAAPKAIVTAEKNFKDKGVSEECLLLFGIGDGGGGPGEEHLERLKREKNLNGLPPVKQEQSIDFFNRIEKDALKYKTWRGELYLEKHQGTYTTQAENKKFNRKMELALRELEYASVLAWMEKKKEYPQSEIEAIWKEVLLYQFHDILPGSSIKRVYDESIVRYKYLLNQTEELTQAAFESFLLENHKNSETPTNMMSKEIEGVSVVNSLSWYRKEWLNINGNWVYVTIPAMSEKQFLINDVQENEFKVSIAKNKIENEILKVTFNEDGSLESIYDKEYSREILSSSGNIITVYDEIGGDAWDYSPVCFEKPQEGFMLKSSDASIDGPKVIIKQIYKYNESILEQEIILRSKSRRVDFVTKVDWKESGKMLRTSFPVNVYTNEVTCDIQFGNIKRSNNDNTSWDMAKYEICAHKYVDLSENNYGVALLNDCKYGYRVKGNVLDLNLLRSTVFPGIEADQGIHEFTYSLYPHCKNHIEGRVIQSSYELNIPLKVISSNKTYLNGIKSPFMEIEDENIIIESVKKAERSDDIIVRLYECSGGRVKTNIDFGFEVKDIQLVNLLEEAVGGLEFNKESMELKFKPFEIHTLKITI